jgi:hypothetical protein
MNGSAKGSAAHRQTASNSPGHSGGAPDTEPVSRLFPDRAALFAQAIRGPILLITVGILFALHQAGVLSFFQTWPLVVIVAGVMMLIERLFVPRGPSPGGPRL